MAEPGYTTLSGVEITPQRPGPVRLPVALLPLPKEVHMTGARGPRTSTALLEAAVLACFHPATALNRTEIAERTGRSRRTVERGLQEFRALLGAVLYQDT